MKSSGWLLSFIIPTRSAHRVRAGIGWLDCARAVTTVGEIDWRLALGNCFDGDATMAVKVSPHPRS